MLTANQFLPENPLHIDLPSHQAAGDGTDILWAILPAFFGATVGVVFVLALPRLQDLLSLTGGVVIQTLMGSALFAGLVTIFPILRFSGHHELEAMLHWSQSSGMAALLALAVLKALALALCLASGWRGGAAFPLLFAGAAAGGATLWLLPQIPVTVALVAGMAAAITVGMGRPIVAMLISLLLIGPAAMGPLMVGNLIGWGVSKRTPSSALH